MRFRLWAQIAATLTINLLLLGLLARVLLTQQMNSGLDSFLYAPAREGIREIGRLVEEEFPGTPDAERTAWLAKIQAPYGVTLAVYEDTGHLVAGPELGLPEAVRKEIERGPRRGRDESKPGPGPRPGRETKGKGKQPNGPPMFLVKEESPSRYWIGYHFPIVLEPGYPPVRHTLLAISSSLLSARLFVDWRPWVAGASLALFVTVVCWIPLIQRVTRSVSAVRVASAEIAEGHFDVRIPVSGGDELGDLASSVRRMAEQLSHLIHGQNRFLADVAHELCAPLSRIQLSAGILQQSTTGNDAKSIVRLERDVAYMSALVGDLLSFTKGTVRKAEMGPVVLAELVQRVMAQESSAESQVVMDIAPEITVLADAEYLERAVGNLLRNATRYAGESGPIQIRAQRTGSRVQLVIQDCGLGLPESDLDAIFSPFYRPDTVRTPGTGGAGLGLAIVKSCAEACHGTVFCRNRKPAGLEVVVELKDASEDKRNDANAY